MKRVIVSLMVGIGALLAACTEEDTGIPFAGLVGTYDVALVGDRVFVTSSGRNELRVLELAEDAADRQYARAPNPLEPLAIPVLQRPEALTQDVRYVEGAEVAGPYVYARSNGSTEISVVGADPAILREVRRLSTSQLSASLPVPSVGPVTAFAARGPDESGLSTLYYATQEATGARLWQLRLPGPQELLEGAAVVGPEPLGVELPPNVAVSSLLVMPQPGFIAVSTRGAAGALGKIYKVDVQAKTSTELNFAGAQVLQLATHGRVEYVVTNANGVEETRVLEAGTRLFGVLDASSCGGQPQCTGVLAVEFETGEVSKDITGFAMLPIAGSAGLPMGLSLSTSTNLLLQIGSSRSVQNVALLGIVPLSDGEILFFDAVGLRPFDVDTEAAGSTVTFINAQGVSQVESAAIAVDVTNGVTTNNTYQLIYQGILPGMSSLPRTPRTTVFEVPSEPRAGKGQVVQPGDIIVLFPETAGLQPCATDVVVDSVQPPATPGGNAVLVPRGALPSECDDFTRFLVRAAGNQPLILSDPNEDYIQRLGVSESFSRTGSYFFHPDDYQGQSEGLAVRITVTRLPEGLVRGELYVVNTLSRYFPFAITVDIGVDALSEYRLPGPVVQANVGGTSYAYIAYPSADGLLQVNLQAIFVDVANSSGVYPYR